MKYRIIRENRLILKNYGRRKAVAVHENEVGALGTVDDMCRRAKHGCLASTIVRLSGVTDELQLV